MRSVLFVRVKSFRKKQKKKKFNIALMTSFTLLLASTIDFAVNIGDKCAILTKHFGIHATERIWILLTFIQLRTDSLIYLKSAKSTKLLTCFKSVKSVI